MKLKRDGFNLFNPIHFLALGFGSGLMPKAPGTFGTLPAIPLVLVASALSSINYMFLVVVMTIIGVYLCGQTSKDVGVDDHSAIVWDEIVGFMITMFAIPISWYSILLGFILFRLFDIVKPWPISFVDKHCHGGIGIMLDDVLAGLAAWICMYYIFIF